MTNFVAERKFALDAKGFVLTSKMLGFDVLTKLWNSCYVDEPTEFSVLGYTVVATLTWEDEGRTLVSTTVTTAADGYVLSGWTATTRMTHRIDEETGEMVCVTIAPEGEYANWLSKQPAEGEGAPAG